jgi:hypothetical protein
MKTMIIMKIWCVRWSNTLKIYFFIYSDFFAVGGESDMGSTRPDMNWHSTHGDRDNSYPGKLETNYYYFKKFSDLFFYH